jgi:hypothetical protein
MPTGQGTVLGNFGVYKFGFLAGAGANQEDLLDLITNVDPYDTPWVTQAPKTQASHVVHEWLTDTLGSVDTSGSAEGADYAYDSSTTPARVYNVTMILRQDIGVSETQRAVNPAGFKDAYAYEVQKATKRLAIKLETIIFANLTSATGTNATAGGSANARVMRNLQSFIATNTAYANGGSAASAGVLTSLDFNSMLQTIYASGGNPEQCYVSPSVKRQISAFTVTQQNRNISAVEKKLVNAVDVYDSDFGLIQIVLDRWVPQGANTTTAAVSAGDVAGQIFFLQRAMNRLAWLRPMAHSLIGKRGDNVAGIVLGEVTLEVLNEKANGRIVSVNNKSAVT